MKKIPCAKLFPSYIFRGVYQQWVLQSSEDLYINTAVSGYFHNVVSSPQHHCVSAKNTSRTVVCDFSKHFFYMVVVLQAMDSRQFQTAIQCLTEVLFSFQTLLHVMLLSLIW